MLMRIRYFLPNSLIKQVLPLVLSAFWMLPASATPESALDDYINAPDPSYNYTLASPPVTGPGFTMYVFYMNSQLWRSPAEVDRIAWTHWLRIVVPDVVNTDTGMLIIAGGRYNSPPNSNADEVAAAAQIAITSRSVVAVVGQIPSQPLFFSDEPFAHSEDELVAYTFDKALDTGDWQWPAYLPMAKAVVRAMDTTQAVADQIVPGAVDRFVLTGFSKRGGAAWIAAIVDPRVRAIAPGVFDILNMDEQVEHHFSAYGFYSDALSDYVNYNILRRVRTPEGQALMQVVDPISYRDRLTMPKFILNSSGDPFFTSDSARFYFDKLYGENMIRYVANTGHGLQTTPGNIEDALTSLTSWYLSILYNLPRPNIRWEHVDGNLVVRSDQVPLFARFWQANNPTARDFRLETIDRSWSLVPLQPVEAGLYSAPIPNPAEGWSAYFVDLIYQGVGGIPQTYSTSVFVSPDTVPFEVTDPLGNPRGRGFWKRQIRVALGGSGRSSIPSDTLAGYFPIPLFDQYVKNIEEAASILNAKRAGAGIRAKQHCLALRLNVRHGQLGWYTPLVLEDEDDDENHKADTDKSANKLWQYYAKAHDAFLAGKPKIAKSICEEVNEFDD